MVRQMCRYGWLMTSVLFFVGCFSNEIRLSKGDEKPVTEPVALASAPRPVDEARPHAESWNLLLAQATPNQVPQDTPVATQEPGPLELPPPPPTKSQNADMPPSRDVAPPSPPAVSPSVEAPTNDAASLRRLFKQADEECAILDSYICRMTRREQVNGSNKPEEIMLFKFRKQPFSVYFKWIGNEGKGREVVYVKGQHGNKLHTLLAAGDNPFKGAGSRMELAPDSIFIRRSSRHPIDDAGICSILEKYGAAVSAAEKGQRTMRFLGIVKRSDFDGGVTLEGAEDDVPPGVDPNLPRGGRRQLFFDTVSHLPVLLITKDERGQEVEYYRFDRFQKNVKLDDDDFNPDKLWKK
jgi:hypothetical protein